MPRRLAFHLPFLTDEQRAELFGSIYAAAAYPRGNPIREGVIGGKHSLFFSVSVTILLTFPPLAYDDVMKILTIAATVFAAVPFFLSFFVPDWYLGDQQNAVDNVDLAGEKVHNPDVSSSPATSEKV